MKKINFLLLWGLAISFFACSDDLGDKPTASNAATGSEMKRGEFITLKSGQTVEERDGMFFFGGDMALSESQLELLDETGELFLDPKQIEALKPSDSIPVNSASGMTAYYYEGEVGTRATGRHPYQNMFWAMVRYSFSPDLDSWSRQLIVQAMRQIEAQTNVRFYNATNQPVYDTKYGFYYPYIHFIENKSDPFGSWSYVGRLGGKQELAVGLFVDAPNIMHEICHAVGMFHEHQRYDRDSYVTINYNNMISNRKSDYTKITTNYYCVGGFDFNSIMIYDSQQASSNGQPTMVRKSNNQTIPRTTKLSDMDRRWLNTFYIPYIARSDVYAELAQTVYKPDNTIMTAQERLQFQAQLNNGNPNPPSTGRIPNDLANPY